MPTSRTDSPAAVAERGARPRWYDGVTSAQWRVLAVASAGWVFDAYASQVFNVTRGSLLGQLLPASAGPDGVKFWGEVLLGLYLVGGAVGGTLFGSLADRIGRRPTMILTILTYTIFSGVTYFAHSVWQVAAFRFVVALGTAGAWAVGASLVAEVFSARSRAQAGAVFHATSNIGTWLASLTGMWVGTNWRLGYLTGLIPIVLVFWVGADATESPEWREQAAHHQGRTRGSLRELLSGPCARPALLGMLLAAVALGTYWCITVGGQDLIQAFLMRRGMPAGKALERAEFGYGWLINGGGFIGAIAFGPFAQWLGRRRAFACALIGGAIIVPITWYLPQSYAALLALLPFYGMLTFGYHAGFAFYFPELFPTHLRGTGTGFCFNAGRLIAALILLFSGWLKSRPGLELRAAASLLALFYLAGLICVAFLPETKNEVLTDDAAAP